MPVRVHSASRRIAIGVPALLLAATALAACGGDDNNDKGVATPAGSATSGTTSVLGPDKKATGTPVKVGFAFEGTTAAIDTSAQGKAAQAVAAYANEHLGGIGGHPIELVLCETKNTPANAATCGNTFVSEKVVAVTSGSLGQTDPVVKAINAAGIALVDAANTSALVIQGTTNFSLNNPLNPFGGPAALAKQKGITRVGLIVIDVPAAIEPAKQISPLLFGNAGVQVDVIGVAPGTADPSATIQAEEAKKPGAYHIIGDTNFCTTIFKSIRTLGVKSPVTTIDRCLSKTGAASVPGGYEGVQAFSTTNLDPADSEYKLYIEILKKYGNGMEHSANAAAGYQGILGMIRAVNAASITDLSPAGVSAAMKSAPATPMPLGGGATFQCNGKAVAIAPAVCTAAGFTGTSNKDGELSNFQKFEDSSIYKAPTK
ncbi:MAG: putative branched-chain amino acid transporter, amino acid-binding protein [Frankiales bacterium]|nr:putative branched-chain amino acid transporter, amino acid-binding protein [Frankiales bacterium]